MNSFPLIRLMIAELESRDDAYGPSSGLAQTILYREVHNGRIERRFVSGPRALTGDGLDERSTEELRTEIDASLGAILTSLHGQSADAHREVSELRDLFNAVE